MFSIFTLAIKFDCLFLAIFQSFDLFVSFIFDKLAPPPVNTYFKRCFKSLFSSFQCKKSVLKVLKTRYFSYSAFLSTGQWGWGGGYGSPGYATVSNQISRIHATTKKTFDPRAEFFFFNFLLFFPARQFLVY